MAVNHIGLEIVLVELYCSILDLIYSLLGSISSSVFMWSPSVPWKINPASHNRPQEQLKIIKDLNAKARVIEATLDEDTRKAQAAQRDEVMRAEISGIKNDIARLQTEMSEVGAILKASLAHLGMSTRFRFSSTSLDNGSGITLRVPGLAQLASQGTRNTNGQHQNPQLLSPTMFELSNDGEMRGPETAVIASQMCNHGGAQGNWDIRNKP